MSENEKKCCENKDNKSCKDKTEKICKKSELESQIESLSNELNLAKKTIEEQKSTITSYLSTASYYKNELDSQKKDFDRYKERNKNFEAEASQKANESLLNFSISKHMSVTEIHFWFFQLQISTKSANIGTTCTEK